MSLGGIYGFVRAIIGERDWEPNLTSAMIDEPAGERKLALIRRFLVANGTQAEIDSGSFLQRFAVPGGAIFTAGAASGGMTLQQGVDTSMRALLNAYEKHRATWQEEYERHVNWAFSEEELSLMVAFLESPVGKHFLEGRWSMGAYVGTNTEHLIEEIVTEAKAGFDGGTGLPTE